MENEDKKDDLAVKELETLITPSLHPVFERIGLGAQHGCFSNTLLLIFDKTYEPTHQVLIHLALSFLGRFLTTGSDCSTSSGIG